MLFVTERQDTHAGGLRKAAKVGYRDAGNTVDRVQIIQLQRVDKQVKTVSELRLVGFVARFRWRSIGPGGRIAHVFWIRLLVADKGSLNKSPSAVDACGQHSCRKGAVSISPGLQ